MRKAALKKVGELVTNNEKIIFIGSDLTAGTLKSVKEFYPSRVLIEGIAEQHLIGFASGLALEGFFPIVHTISPFIYRRGLEQLIVDCALQNVPVTFLASGGGLVYTPLGPTHVAIDDFAHLTPVPNLNLIAPCDPLEMEIVLELITISKNPNYIRVAKGGEPVISGDWENLSFGRSRMVKKGEKLAVISTGSITHEVVKSLERLAIESINVTLVHFPYLRPFDDGAVRKLNEEYDNILVIEEHIEFGGLLSLVLHAIKYSAQSKIFSLNVPFKFTTNYGNQSEHLEEYSLDSKGIEIMIRRIISGEVVNEI